MTHRGMAAGILHQVTWSLRMLLGLTKGIIDTQRTGPEDSPPGGVVSVHILWLNKGIIDTQRNGSRDIPPGGVVSAHAPRVNKRNN